MVVCHTIVPEVSEKGQLEYHGSSPDESALVRGAADLGIVFKTRTPDHVIIDKLGEEQKYYVDHTLNFNSDRKRMSVIVHNGDNNYCIYTKGAVS